MDRREKRMLKQDYEIKVLDLEYESKEPEKKTEEDKDVRDDHQDDN